MTTAAILICPIMLPFGTGDAAPFFKTRHNQAQAVAEAGEHDQSGTLSLVRVDPLASYIGKFDGCSLDQQQVALSIGLIGCTSAVNDALKLADLPCVAFYKGLMAEGLYRIKDFAAARQMYGEAIEVSRNLGTKEPQLYAPRVAGMLCNLANVLADRAVAACPVAELLEKG